MFRAKSIPFQKSCRACRYRIAYRVLGEVMSKENPTKKEIKAIILLVENGWLKFEVTPSRVLREIKP